MPRFRQHLMINSTVLVAVDIVDQLHEMEHDPSLKFDWKRLLSGVSVGCIAGALPDLLEPSIGNPNHRGVAHSLAAAAAGWWLVAGRHSETWPKDMRHLARAAAIGYSLHLAADLFLSKGKGMGLFGRDF